MILQGGFVISDIVFGSGDPTYNPRPVQELSLLTQFSVRYFFFVVLVLLLLVYLLFYCCCCFGLFISWFAYLSCYLFACFLSYLFIYFL